MWKIFVKIDGANVRYFIKTKNEIPTTLSDLNDFLIRKTEDFKEEDGILTSPYIITNKEKSVLDIYDRNESKFSRKMFLSEIKIYPFCRTNFFSFTTLFFKNKKNRIISKKALFNIPHIFLSIDFSKHTRFLHRKDIKKYLNIEKTLKLFESDNKNGILKINAFPYLQNDYYLNLNNYDFDKHSLVIGGTGTGKSKLLSLLINNIYNLEKSDKTMLFLIFTTSGNILIAIIKFAISGGFAEQITALKADIFKGISNGFTLGTVSVLTSGAISDIIAILLLIEVLVLVISYYQTESKAKAIIASICLGSGLVLFGVAGFVLAVGYGVINVSEQMETKVAKLLEVFDSMQTAALVNWIVAAIGVVILVVFFVLLLLSKHKWMIKNSIIAILFCIIVPLFLLLVENIIPLIVGIVASVLIGGAVFLCCKIFLNSGDGESSSSNIGESVVPASSNTPAESKSKEKYQKKKEYDINTIFWRDKGGYGIAVPQADCIYMNNTWGQKTYVCTVQEFEKGDVVIINKRVRVVDIAGCKTPLR